MIKDIEVLDGFIDSLASFGYRERFYITFPHLRCHIGDDQFVRYWSNSKKRVSKSDKVRVEFWHDGYRNALKVWRPKDYMYHPDYPQPPANP